MRLLLVLGVVGGVLACVEPGGADAGPTTGPDAGPGDVELDDAGPRDGPCDVAGFNAPGTCDPAQVCVPLDGSRTEGICRRACGDLDLVDGGVAGGAQDETVCPPGQTCQFVTAMPGAEIVAVACVPRAQARDEVCTAVFDDALGDDDACPAGTECQVVAVAVDDGGTAIASGSACKEPCDPAGVAPCSRPEESCLPRPFDDGHNCALPIPTVTAVDAAAALAEPDLRCNEVDASRYCDEAAGAVCVGVSASSNDGLCLALCGAPFVDRNGDGDFDDDGELGSRIECPSTTICSGALPVALGLLDDLRSEDGRLIGCDIDLCPTGAPCLACPGGDTTCLLKDGIERCVAFPFLTCEPGAP